MCWYELTLTYNSNRFIFHLSQLRVKSSCFVYAWVKVQQKRCYQLYHHFRMFWVKSGCQALNIESSWTEVKNRLHFQENPFGEILLMIAIKRERPLYTIASSNFRHNLTPWCYSELH